VAELRSRRSNLAVPGSSPKMLEKAKKVYGDVVDFGDPQWATAALYRYGNIFQVFADSLRNAPIPPGFSKAEATQYREELENFIIEVEEGAIESYTFAYQKSLELEVYSEYTRKIREALGKLDSSTFPPVIEARSRERFGNRPLPPELVTEVIRDEE